MSNDSVLYRDEERIAAAAQETAKEIVARTGAWDLLRLAGETNPELDKALDVIASLAAGETPA